MVNDVRVTPQSAVADQPVRRATTKRERTRILLLDAAIDVLAEDGEGFSLARIPAQAGVAHGTFYNYFPDRDALMDALVPYSVEKFAERSELEVHTDDEAERFAVISARALRAAADSPNVVRVALRLDSVRRALAIDGPLSYLGQNIKDGHRNGRFANPLDEGTYDVILGALLLAARRVINGESSDDHQVSVIAHLLLALGIDGQESRTLARRAVSMASSSAIDSARPHR